MATDRPIHPVILSGGNGTRLWPLSRGQFPKQFLALGEPGRSMLQQTVARVAASGFAAPLVVCNEDHRFLVAEQLRDVQAIPRAIVLEPAARNTAPAAAVAALLLAGDDPDAIMLILPSDHLVRNVAAFRAATMRAADAATATGALVTFGIAPDHPATGYGYIRAGEALAGFAGCHGVELFIEKPDLATAERLISEGGCSWNSGMFLFTAGSFLDELRRLRPEMLDACRAALADARTDSDFCRLAAGPFAAIRGESIDYAVMEHTERAVVVPIDIGWNDVGAWSALWDSTTADGDGNVCLGDVIAVDSKGSYLRSDGPLLATVGIDDAVVVATPDAVLVARKDQVQDVRKVVDRLKAAGRAEHEWHPKVFRPWGSYEGLREGDRFQVKHIVVKPGGKLSLQMHHHRAEHWIVVSGTARVTRGDECVLLHENQSTYIPIGVRHRLENPGKIPLHLIEVQSGGYLQEDDIVRFEDTYGRDVAAE